MINNSINELDCLTNEEIKHNYYELLYAVCRKFQNETRHQTALRYIKEAEEVKSNVASEVKSNISKEWIDPKIANSFEWNATPIVPPGK